MQDESVSVFLPEGTALRAVQQSERIAAFYILFLYRGRAGTIFRHALQCLTVVMSWTDDDIIIVVYIRVSIPSEAAVMMRSVRPVRTEVRTIMMMVVMMVMPA